MLFNENGNVIYVRKKQYPSTKETILKLF